MTTRERSASTTPVPRTRRGRAVDRTLSRVLKLPRATGDYAVERGVTVPMRDGVDLLADVYAPTGSSRGTILVRGPYGRGGPFPLLFARVYAERGYHVVLQSCRGTFGSGDVFAPMRSEIEDGADTVAWLREQPWFGGRFATLGLSYLGFTQLALMTDPPPELACALVMVGPHDMWENVHGGGSFKLNDFLGWSDMVAHQEEGSVVSGLVRQARAGRRLAPALAEAPLVEAGERVLAGGAPWYRDWVSQQGGDHPYWTPMRLSAALDRVQVPVLLFGGWQDLFLEQTLEQYAHLHGRGVDVALTIGPWTHTEMLSKGASVTTHETLDWLAEHLAGTGTRRRPAPVHLYVTGADEWRDLPSWPPASTEQVLYLQPFGALGDEPPAPDLPPSTFTYDPADPTPSAGGAAVMNAGPVDNRAVEQRPDVLTYTSEPVASPLVITGPVTAELFAASSRPHTDFFARLCDVDPGGKSVNITDGILRLTSATEEPQRVAIDLWPTAHQFQPGHRIRLQVSSGAHPRYARNPGSGEPLATATTLHTAQQAVYHDRAHPSAILLPVLATS